MTAGVASGGRSVSGSMACCCVIEVTIFSKSHDVMCFSLPLLRSSSELRRVSSGRVKLAAECSGDVERDMASCSSDDALSMLDASSGIVELGAGATVRGGA